MKPGYISVDRFLDFMNRPDLDEFRPGNQEVIQDDEKEFDNFEVDVFGLQRQSDNSEPEAMEDGAVSLSLLTESESNKRRWMELMSSTISNIFFAVDQMLQIMTGCQDYMK